jgi:hypothetical protein
LQVTNTVRLPVNEFFEAEIPHDAVGIVRVGVQAGQFIRPLVEKSTFNNLANFDTSSMTQINYPSPQEDTDIWGVFINSGLNTNDNGENVGGYFGLGVGVEPDTYKIIPERGIIQLNSMLAQSVIVLEYVGDGSFSNSFSKVDPYAQKAIEAYMDWQYKLHSRTYNMGESEQAKKIFDREQEKLRARKNNLTPEKVLRIINRHSKASIKQ